MEKSVSESQQLLDLCSAFREQMAVSSDIAAELGLRSLELNSVITQRANDIEQKLERVKRKRDLVLLTSTELETAEELWRDLRNGVPNAPARLPHVSPPVRLVIMKALSLALAHKSTADNLYVVFEL